MFCRHRNTTIIRFRALKPATIVLINRDKATANKPAIKTEGVVDCERIIQLRGSQQYYECLDCGKNLGPVGIYAVS